MLKSRTSELFALAGVLGVAAFGTFAVGADAKSASLLPMPCTNGTAASAVFSRQGANYRIGMGASGAGSLGTWHATEIDNGTNVLIDDTFTFDIPQWDILSFATLAKGNHSLAVHMENLTTGETCDTTITTKV
jgi:hypothetical protein